MRIADLKKIVETNYPMAPGLGGGIPPVTPVTPYPGYDPKKKRGNPQTVPNPKPTKPNTPKTTPKPKKDTFNPSGRTPTTPGGRPAGYGPRGAGGLGGLPTLRKRNYPGLR